MDRITAVQDRLAGWVSDLTTLHELTERLARTHTLDAALQELLRAGASLAGARRGLVLLEPADGEGPVRTVGLGLDRAELGAIETIPRADAAHGRILDGLPANPLQPDRPPADHLPAERLPDGASAPGGPPADDVPTAGPQADGRPPETHPGTPEPGGIARPDLLGDPGLAPRHREVAGRLGFAASYTVPLAADATGPLGAAVWLYDEPAEPLERHRHLIDRYARYAGEHLARQLELARARRASDSLREELLPSRLPRAAGVRLAVRHRAGPRGGGGWYDALPLPEGTLALAVGGVTGSGPGAVAAMARLRAALRAYAVMEGEDPVAVLSDLELLLRLTEPARSATALFAYCEPALPLPGGPAGDARHRVVLAGAGHCPPLLVGPGSAEYIETSLSAPLGMLSAWEAPSVVVEPAPGETLLLYTDGLLHRTGQPVDQASERLRNAAAALPPALRGDPDALVGHVLRTLLPGDAAAGAGSRHGPGSDGPCGDGRDDVVLLAARFD